MRDDSLKLGALHGGDVVAERPLWPAVMRGLRCTCPNCGEGKLFDGYLTSVERCSVCSEEIHHHRADDLPPYLTVFIVGHLVVGLFMAVEQSIALSMWTHLAIWVPVTLILSLVLLRPLKGGTIGLQWALRQGGFGDKSEEDRIG